MNVLLELLSQKNLHVHTIDLEARKKVMEAYCSYEKNEFKKCFDNTYNATHYIMHDADVVFVGTQERIPNFVKDFNE
jgi:hypothetical protein